MVVYWYENPADKAGHWKQRVALKNLHPTNNVLDVEVANLEANYIRDLDIRGVQWKTFHDAKFVDISYRKFDASGWPVQDSGLLGPVRLRPMALMRMPAASSAAAHE